MAENNRTITIDDLEWDVVPDIIPAIEANTDTVIPDTSR